MTLIILWIECFLLIDFWSPDSIVRVCLLICCSYKSYQFSFSEAKGKRPSTQSTPLAGLCCWQQMHHRPKRKKFDSCIYKNETLCLKQLSNIRGALRNSAQVWGMTNVSSPHFPAQEASWCHLLMGSKLFLLLAWGHNVLFQTMDSSLRTRNISMMSCIATAIVCASPGLNVLF